MEQNHITKPHYEILNGLRGVAAVMVVAFHVVVDSYAENSQFIRDNILSHAYMAVDFFFMLSGFVIGYAYDDRWEKMSAGNFIKRRIFRLHPMVIFGTLLGLILFYFGASTIFPLIRDVPLWKVLLFAVMGMLLIPATPKMDIRGWKEMYTLDAPIWSLFYEYIANILYALFIRRFSKIALAILVTIAAGATCYLTLTNGDVIGGWEFSSHTWSSLLLVAVLVVPRIGGDENIWMNGLYEAIVIIIVFPIIVLMGAGGDVKGKYTVKACKLLGDISYPVYLVNYPLCYIHIGWLRLSDTGTETKYTFAQVWWVSASVFVASILIAYLALKFFDEPIRKYLSKKFS